MSDNFIPLGSVSGSPKASEFIPLSDIGKAPVVAPAGPSTTASGLTGAVTRGLAPYAAGAATGAALGAPFGGVGAIPGAVAGAGAVGLTQLATSLYDPLAAKFGWPKVATPQEMTDKVLDLAGVKRPSTATERVAETAAGGAAGAATGAGAAGLIEKVATNPVVKGVAGRMAEAPVSQAISGATGGASAQVSDEHGAGPVGQTIAGMAGALAPTVAGNVAGRVIAPKVSQPVRELMDAGVDLTPGQLAGDAAMGIPKRAEETSKSIPGAGAFIRAAEGRAIDTFNVATANKALDPIGVVLPKRIAGHQIIAAGQKALSQAYDDVLPNLSFSKDATFTADITALAGRKAELGPYARQFDAILKNRVENRLAASGGVFNGDMLKQVQSELSYIGGRYRSSSDAAQRALGDLLEETNHSIREALERQNPDYADRLRDINHSYAMFVRVENAAARRSAGNGRFTPADLLASIKAADKSVRKRAYARGDSLLQDWGETANKVISNTVPDSGTTERALGVGGAAALAVNHPVIAGSMAASALPYTKPGMAAARYYASPGAARAAIGDALRGPVAPIPMITAASPSWAPHKV